MATEPAIGTTIKRARLRKRMTQKQLAKAAGVSLRAVNDWENGRSYPRNHIAVEEILGVSLDPPGDDLSLSPELRSMIENLTDDERELVMAELAAADRRLSGRGEGDPRPGGQRRAG